MFMGIDNVSISIHSNGLEMKEEPSDKYPVIVVEKKKEREREENKEKKRQLTLNRDFLAVEEMT